MPSGEPTHADQLLRPFRRVLKDYPQIPAELLQRLDERDPTQRMGVRLSQEMLRGLLELTGDPDLGLRAAQATEVGDFEVFEYVAASAPTWRAGFEALIRYSMLLNGAADFRLEEDHAQARVVLHSTVELNRAGVDFQVAAFHVAFARRRLREAGDLQVCFRHPRPVDAGAYAQTFGDTQVFFDADFDGFRFDHALLDQPVRTADASLHAVLRGHADGLLAEFEPSGDWVQRVRTDILENLTRGRPAAEKTAARLGVSRRSLTRKLGEHATNFTELLADVRRRSAVRYLEGTKHSVEEIAFLLGFSESPPFVRAFKRWTGASPLEFRKR